MASPISHYLPTFAPVPAASPPRRLTPLGGRTSARAEAAARNPVAEAEERGRQQAAEAAQAEMEAARAADRKAFEERLAAERATWQAEVADRLAGQLAAAMQQVEAALSDAVMGVLAPFLDRAIQERTLAEFVQTLARLKDGRDLAIRISGPEALLVALRGPISALHAVVEYVPAAGVDVRAVIGDTAIETKIGAWCDRLMASLEGAGNG